ncbi:hypothetical protein PCE1_001062 [Barthelona sp. PCE]
MDSIYTHSTTQVLRVNFKGKVFLIDVGVHFDDTSSIADLKVHLSSLFSLPQHRIRIKRGLLGLNDFQSLLPIVDELDETDSALTARDLGPQVSPRVVYVIEYLGPIFVWLAVFAHRYLFVECSKQSHTCHTLTENHRQILASILWLLHYVRRAAESMFLHKFTHSTFPIKSLFKNCLYYWGFAFFIARDVFKLKKGGIPSVHDYHFVLTFFWVVCQFLNHYCHRVLRKHGDRVLKLPFKDGKPRRILPKNWVFKLCITPNYFFEVLTWISFTGITRSIVCALFTILGFLQMFKWAMDKKKKLLADGSDYQKIKKMSVIMPFLL